MARAYSRYTLEALSLLGSSISAARKDRRMTADELAARVGITRVTLRKIENGDPTVELGLAFETAAIVGVPLFSEDRPAVQAEARRIDDRLSLLPKSVRRPRIKINDDF